MGIQFKNQQALNQQGHDLSYDMWEKTNYGPQMKMMKEAGLNPALMYGMGGQGGTTSQSGGGSASGGSSPAYSNMGDIAMGVDAAVKIAQAELLKKQADKTEAEKDKLTGVDTEEAKSRINKNNVQAKTGEILNRVEDWKWRSDMTTREIAANINTLEQELDIIQRNNLVEGRTMYNKIETIKNEAVYSAIKIEAENQNIKLSKQKENQLWHQIRQEWVKAGLQGLDTIIKGRLKDIGTGSKGNQN